MKHLSSVIAAFVVLTLAATWPLPLKLTSSFPGDYGDPLFISWVIGWVSRQLTAAVGNPFALRTFWDANIFYPEPTALAYSEHFIPQTLLALPVVWTTDNLILAYNIVFLASFILTAVGTTLVARALTGSAMAAMLAGVVASFNEYRLRFEVAHLQTLSIFWFPFVLLGVHHYLVTRRKGALVLAAIAWWLLNLSSIYYLAYCTPFVVLFGLCEMLRLGRWREPRVWRDLTIAALAVVAVTFPFVWPYARLQQQLGFARSAQEVVTLSATLDNYRIALPRLVIPVGLSLVALVASAIGAVRRGKSDSPKALPLAGSLAVLTLLAIWLSLGPVVRFEGRALPVPGVYDLLATLPGYDGLRVPARFASVFLVFLGLLAAVGVGVSMRRWPRVRVVASAAAIGGFLWQNLHPLPLDQPLPTPGLGMPPAYLTPSARMPPIYRAIERLPDDAAIAELPFGDPWYEVRYMFFAATHARRLLNGYSGVFPPSYVARRAVLSGPWNSPERTEAALRDATHVVIHTTAWPGNTGADVAAQLEQRGARLVGEVDRALLYELPKRTSRD